MASLAGHVAGTVGRPAPVLPTVLRLLALLGPQEEEAVVWQEDPESRTLLHVGTPRPRPVHLPANCICCIDMNFL